MNPFLLAFILLAVSALLFFVGQQLIGNYHMRRNLLTLSNTEHKDLIPQLIAEKTRITQSLKNSSLLSITSNENYAAAMCCYNESEGFLRLASSEESRATACAFAKQALIHFAKI